MTAAQWFHDALTIYRGEPDQDRVARSIIKMCVGSPADAVDLAAFLAHLQAVLRDDALSQEETNPAQ